jgi:protein-tyrosine-phosphatase
MTGGSVDVASAGSHPAPIHLNTVRVLAERGIDVSGARSTHVDELVGRPFDVVVTLCDRVREVCPDWEGMVRRVHWSIADPSLAGETAEESYPAFERTVEELERRIRFLIPTIRN